MIGSRRSLGDLSLISLFFLFASSGSVLRISATSSGSVSSATGTSGSALWL